MISDPERYTVANQIITWAAMPGFEEVIGTLRADVEAREKAASNAPLEMPDATVRRLYLAWQESRRALALIEDQVANAKQYVQDVNSEEADYAE